MSPSAAAQAWLARLPPAERAAAAAHTDWRLAAFALTGVVLIALSIVVLKGQVLARLRRVVEADGPKPILASAALAAVFGFIVLAAKALLDAVSRWQGDEISGHPAQFAGYLGAQFSGLVTAVGVLVILATALYWLARRAPRVWPFIAGPLAAVALVAYGWLPYALHSDRGLPALPAGPLRAALVQLMADARIPANEVYVSADPQMDVDVTGGFGRANVVVGPRLLHAPTAEVTAMVGHVMGHYAHGDIFSIWVLFGLLTFAGFVVASLAFRPLARTLGAGGLSGPADPEGLPVMAVIAVLWIGVGTLALNGFVRYVNVGADEFSLTHARAPDGLAAVLEREWDHESVDPSALEAALFYTHPPMQGRIVHAMTWKAAHGG